MWSVANSKCLPIYVVIKMHPRNRVNTKLATNHIKKFTFVYVDAVDQKVKNCASILTPCHASSRVLFGVMVDT